MSYTRLTVSEYYRKEAESYARNFQAAGMMAREARQDCPFHEITCESYRGLARLDFDQAIRNYSLSIWTGPDGGGL